MKTRNIIIGILLTSNITLFIWGIMQGIEAKQSRDMAVQLQSELQECKEITMISAVRLTGSVASSPSCQEELREVREQLEAQKSYLDREKTIAQLAKEQNRRADYVVDSLLNVIQHMKDEK